ncbi:hypothetical protein AZE42_10446 [Rhizopogon vesiculosus]|uniref:Uncharacterized protein n=1 Tax=Rhizopogon vesiculosus TaxID=180088 RepID=A0A1J8QL17_9AGAM|nr:hypothetical protein AZE42_10446 [Rhizopogon vesiculosus]
MILYAPADIAVGRSLLYLNYAYGEINKLVNRRIQYDSSEYQLSIHSRSLGLCIITFDDEVHIRIASIPARVSELNHYEAGIST